ncbi:MAG: hypothetical protein GKS00_24315 [Alphaproteobacteria bacterium]|nr:hypothetical protein [Alphaproteobacteria bacterium]
MTVHRSIVTLRRARRIWAIGSIHGEARRLAALHAEMTPRLAYGDRLVYLGNYLGIGKPVFETISELLRFRRVFLSIPPFMDENDVVLLRGSQEEMWQKLLQLQFSNQPAEVLAWMLDRGVATTLEAYDGRAEEGFANAKKGVVALTSWTSKLRDAVRAAPGHEAMVNALKRAAVSREGGILFVNAGVDIDRPLSQQTDSFWWAGRSFSTIREPYEGFRRVVRGYDPDHGGIAETEATLTIDAGCGFGGSLAAYCLTPEGEVLERLEA